MSAQFGNFEKGERQTLPPKYLFYVFVCAKAQITAGIYGKTVQVFSLLVGASGYQFCAHDITVYILKIRGAGGKTLEYACVEKCCKDFQKFRKWALCTDITFQESTFSSGSMTECKMYFS